jgi:hypothetical protein
MPYIKTKKIFYILFIIISIIFCVSSKAQNVNGVIPSWLTPLDPFGSSSSTSSYGYLSSNNLGCGFSCDSVCGSCLNEYTYSGQNTVYVCSNNGSTCEETIDGCSEGDESCSKEPVSVYVYIKLPEGGVFDGELPVKPDDPIKVPVRIGWEVQYDPNLVEINKCTASGNWSGNKDPRSYPGFRGGAEDLGKLDLYKDNIFTLDCSYWTKDGEKGTSTGSTHISGKDNTLVIKTNAGSVILDSDTPNGADVPIVSVYDPAFAESIEPGISGGGGDMSFYYLSEYVSFVLGGKIMEAAGSFLGKHIVCGLNTCAKSIKTKVFLQLAGNPAFVGAYKDRILKEHLTRITAKTSREFVIVDGVFVKGVKEGNKVIIKGGLSGKLWHSHPAGSVIPSGASCEYQVNLIKETIKKRFQIKFPNEIWNDGYYKEILTKYFDKGYFKNNVHASELVDGSANDLFYMLYKGNKTFPISTISSSGKYVEVEWKALNKQELIEAILNPNYVELWNPFLKSYIKYNRAVIDKAWMGPLVGKDGRIGWISSLEEKNALYHIFE